MEEFLKGDIYHLNKYVVIILFVGVLNNSPKKIEISQNVIRLIITILFLNSLLIIAGFLFNVNMFQAFVDSNRFGYSGMFTKSGESALLYMLITIFFYLKYLKGKSIIPVIYFCIIALLSGKKIVLLIFVLIYLFHFCIKSKYKIYFRVLGIIFLSSLLLFRKQIVIFLLDLFPFLGTYLSGKRYMGCCIFL